MKVAVVGGSREADLLIKALERLNVKIESTADIVVIAAHPFDTDLIDCAILSAKNKTHVLLQRDKWRPEFGDNWLVAKNAEGAAAILATSGATKALLAVGNSRLTPFYRLANIELAVRSRNAPHPPTPPKGEIATGRGPFDLAFETENFRANQIDILVAHNAGGSGGWPKMAAARDLGLPVILIDRPTPPDTPTVTSVDDALNWVARQLGLDLMPRKA
ncbi:MAG: precorrin-6A/cobalt-precorrin-6A reductase [Rhodobacteraceae bacterium]|nr:precorrin-6A/cobalt-precorrin-6A reductase [Paracoccaceae bacterium]